MDVFLRRSVTIALITAGAMTAQRHAPTGSLTFEVAAIKPSKPGTQGGTLHPEPGGRRYVGSNMPLITYLTAAYQLKRDQIVGGPGWIDSDPYDMNAEAEKPASVEDLHIMLQNLLTERLKLKFHFEAREMPALVLSVDKNGPHGLTAHADVTGGDIHLEQSTEGLVHDRLTAHCASIDFFLWRLSLTYDQPLVNQTGLTGCYDFELKFTRELPRGVQEGQIVNGVPIDTYGPTIYQAVQAQLGLKLESKKGPVETMVIDHAERPRED